MFNLEDINLQV